MWRAWEFEIQRKEFPDQNKEKKKCQKQQTAVIVENNEYLSKYDETTNKEKKINYKTHWGKC